MLKEIQRFKSKHIHTLKGLGQSPVMNLIEDQWGVLKVGVHVHLQASFIYIAKKNGQTFQVLDM